MSNGPTQRRSIFGGLLLILIGVFFLLHNFVPWFGIGHIFRRYWPVIFIIWGVAKLIDHLAAQRTGQRSPSVLSGGEVALLILVFIVGAGMAAIDVIHERNPGWDVNVDLFVHSVTSTEELPAQPMKPGGKVAVSTDRGSITIHADETNQLRMIVNKTVNASSDEEGQRRTKDFRVSVTPVADGYQVQTMPGGGVRADLEIHVPKQVSISARTDKGDLSASDFTGAFTGATKNGDVEIHNAAGDVTAEMQHGDARITGVAGNVHLTGRGNGVEITDVKGDATLEGEFFGSIRVHNVAKTSRFISQRTDLTILQMPGRMEMDSGRLEISDTQGGVNLATRNKDVIMENIAGRVHVENRHGDVRVQFREPPREEITISNDSGEIQLTLPANSSFEISATSRSGEVDSDFQAPTLKSVQENEAGHLEGKVGARGPQIHLTTSYGTIHVRKGP